jgi:hypothetical protein
MNVAFVEVANATDTRVRARILPWPALAVRLTTHRVRAAKDGPGYSPTIYGEGARSRCNAGVAAVTCFVADVDHAAPDLAVLAGLAYAVHTTHSHAADDPRHRLILPLAAPVPAADWLPTWRRIRRALCPVADEACKDVSRFYYYASHARGCPGAARWAGGAFLDTSTLPPLPVEPVRPLPAPRDPAAGDRPGDAYNRLGIAEFARLLREHGWRHVYDHGDEQFWCRSGKERGVSATLNYEGSGLLYVFSSAAAPFEPTRSYDLFAAYVLLAHGGDWQAATKALAARGYGVPAAPVEVERPEGLRLRYGSGWRPPLRLAHAYHAQGAPTWAR